MMTADGLAGGPALQEAMRELEAAIHDVRVAFDCISLGRIHVCTRGSACSG